MPGHVKGPLNIGMISRPKPRRKGWMPRINGQKLLTGRMIRIFSNAYSGRNDLKPDNNY